MCFLRVTAGFIETGRVIGDSVILEVALGFEQVRAAWNPEPLGISELCCALETLGVSGLSSCL